MGKKKKQREEMIQNQHSDYTKPAEYKILKKKTIRVDCSIRNRYK